MPSRQRTFRASAEADQLIQRLVVAYNFPIEGGGASKVVNESIVLAAPILLARIEAERAALGGADE